MTDGKTVLVTTNKVNLFDAAKRAQEPAPAMTPERVIATGKQFGQKIGKAEAVKIAAVLKGWRR